MDCSTPGFPVLHYLPEFTQTDMHRVGDGIQPSHPLSSLSPPAFNLCQHQGLFQWVSSSHQWPKYWSFITGLEIELEKYIVSLLKFLSRFPRPRSTNFSVKGQIINILDLCAQLCPVAQNQWYSIHKQTFQLNFIHKNRWSSLQAMVHWLLIWSDYQKPSNYTFVKLLFSSGFLSVAVVTETRTSSHSKSVLSCIADACHGLSDPLITHKGTLIGVCDQWVGPSKGCSDIQYFRLSWA